MHDDLHLEFNGKNHQVHQVPEVLSMDDKGPKGLVHVKGSLIQ